MEKENRTKEDIKRLEELQKQKWKDETRNRFYYDNQ